MATQADHLRTRRVIASGRRRRALVGAAHTAVLAVLGILTFLPVLIMLEMSLKNLYQFNVYRWLPTLPWHVDNYVIAWSQVVGYLWNSFVIATVTVIISITASSLTAYVLARFDFPGRGAVFAAVVGSFLIPIALLTLPLYLLFSAIGLVDTPWAMLIPCLINPFSVYLAKVYTEATIPFELLEAARIDGAGELRIFFSIVLRMMTTGGATVFLLAFVNTWNAFFLPLTVLRGEENWTLNLGLYNWSGKRSESGIDVTSLVLTGALLSIIPMAIMMVAMRRYWRTGVTLGALK